MKINELAEIAGVSPSTVSKVINGREGISAKTRKHVEKILKDNGYFKPLASTKVSRSIELVLDHIESDCTLSFIRSVSYWVQQADYSLSITQLNAGLDMDRCFRGIIDRNPTGVIIHQISKIPETQKKLLDSRNIPYVVVNPIKPVDDDAMWISIDRWTGSFQVVQYLIEQGHKRIGLINGPEDSQSAIALDGGFLAAAHHTDVEFTSSLEQYTDLTPGDAYRAACTLLDLSDRPTAIFVSNERMAMSVYRAAYERGLSIPSDLSVIGFEDDYPADVMGPPLTTIYQSFHTEARKAVEMIIDARRDRDVDKHVILPMFLVKRDSVRKLTD
ncbi:LacI family DNA-binding transcriptional regulator [Bifidobacterium sp. ESL0764]|uniref:LacI family DNA-binding transcriptional regulator n=1 Tax=Bifidobacterium sp. ESL0764 TaxID=2983228 RepID=UPI0023F79342|nr:LacI family DNA-binding transcriptional regulator [Bifidobacterium sp. ESL0764]WEV65006.1 LacI family DNA-binding transcriptional regulator [Bifidobacterium sp. ESL0764]